MVYDIIINGIARTGKDTFIDLFQKANQDMYVHNVSSIDPFRKIPEAFGWNGEKDDNYRMCLHLLKQASKHIDNYPTRFLLKKRETVLSLTQNMDITIFYHIREPKEIDLLLKELPEAVTLIIRGDEETEKACPPSDNEVLDYDYDFRVFNRGTLTHLRDEAEAFKRRIDDFRLYGDEDYR